MPRAKAKLVEVAPLDLSTMTPDQLISAHLALKDWMASEAQRFGEYMAPSKARMEAIDNALLGKLNALGGSDKAQLSSDAGTAYISNIMNVSVTEDAQPYVDPQTQEQSTGRMALLDFALANWESIGNELLLVSPQKDAVRRHMEEHDGLPPPGLKIGFFSRVNVRRS